MRIGVFAVLFGNKPFEETLDYLKELGVGAIEIGTGAYPGNAHCNPAELLADEGKLKAFGKAVEDRGPGHQRAQLPREPDPSGPEDRRRAPHGLRADRAARRTARREAGDHVQRLPRRRPVGEAAQLDHGAVAARVPRDARVAVEGEGHPLLDRDGEEVPVGRRARRHRDAPQLRRLQPRDDAAAARRGPGHHRLQLRSEPHVLAAGGRALGDPRARRLHLPRAREGLPHRRAEHGRERRARRRRSTPTRSSAPGSSAPSATATARASGGTSSRTCGSSATITWSASSTKTA